MATAATAPQPRSANVWQSILEALRGTHQDFTEGSISRAVLLLATPMVLEMFMESLFAIVDVFWVSRLGANSVATVGLTESMLALVFSVAMGVSMSTTAMVARRTGEKDPRGASTAAVQAIALGIVLGVLMGVPGFWFAPQLLGLAGAPAEVIKVGHRYTAIVLGCNVSVMLLFLNNAIFRGAGDASVAMRVLWFSNLINLALDPVLIFGLGPFPAMGVTGAALSTLTGRTCGVLYQTWILTSGRSRIRITRQNLAIVPRVIGSLVRVSSTGVLQWAVANTGWVALVRIISGFGSDAVAGYTVGIRIFIFAILPSWGLSGAAATMVGQNLGARKPDRAQRAVFVTALYNMAYMGLVAAVFILAPKALISVFTLDPAVAPYGVDCLRILGYGNVIYAFGMVMVQSFNGAGDTVTPTIINLIGYWLCEIPLAWALAHPVGMGVRGVFSSIPISELFISLMGLAMFLRGSWKRRRI
jgi:putative MATE family efflux protein